MSKNKLIEITHSIYFKSKNLGDELDSLIKRHNDLQERFTTLQGENAKLKENLSILNIRLNPTGSKNSGQYFQDKVKEIAELRLQLGKAEKVIRYYEKFDSIDESIIGKMARDYLEECD